MEPNYTNSVMGHQAAGITVATFVSRVYLWMTSALFVTFGIGAILSYVPSMQPWLQFLANYFEIIILIELGVALGFGLLINRINALVAGIFFYTYAILNGVFFGLFFTIFEVGSVVFAFGLTAGLFAILAIYGHFTKSDLTRYGQIAYAALFGVILVSVANFFLNIGGLSAILNYVVILIFLVLIAYNAQKLRHFAHEADSNPASATKLALYAAFSLYLDFINLFIRILSLFGRRK